MRGLEDIASGTGEKNDNHDSHACHQGFVNPGRSANPKKIQGSEHNKKSSTMTGYGISGKKFSANLLHQIVQTMGLSR